MGGKQSTAARSRGPFPGVSTDDSAVPPPGGAPHFGHYRAGGGAMGLRSRSVSSVAGMGMDPSTAGGVPFSLYTPSSRGAGDSERAPGGGGSTSDSTYAHGNGYQETGGGHHRDGMLYLGSRASLADALPLHIAPRWFSSHSGKVANSIGVDQKASLCLTIGVREVMVFTWFLEKEKILWSPKSMIGPCSAKLYS
ncbi:E3 ubiquitin-protein ligase ZNRF1 [Camelus dromedarius]|uniref:RING-type E3 ubiquitin transferase n=1 Tax=Camelus dromedarius TaxID=9838 RepID=A0A5N4DTT5_CAMDR|nr:E3 ubiquitin-protein ligase ZNRF1 [Camelus dromedarius]